MPSAESSTLKLGHAWSVSSITGQSLRAQGRHPSSLRSVGTSCRPRPLADRNLDPLRTATWRASLRQRGPVLALGLPPRRCTAPAPLPRWRRRAATLAARIDGSYLHRCPGVSQDSGGGERPRRGQRAMGPVRASRPGPSICWTRIGSTDSSTGSSSNSRWRTAAPGASTSGLRWHIADSSIRDSEWHVAHMSVSHVLQCHLWAPTLAPEAPHVAKCSQCQPLK